MHSIIAPEQAFMCNKHLYIKQLLKSEWWATSAKEWPVREDTNDNIMRYFYSGLYEVWIQC